MFKKFLLISLIFTNVQAWEYSPQLTPQYSREYYIEQSLKYFDTLDTFASRDSKPSYAKKVIRWEWYPWLYLTGYKKHWMKLDRLLILYPTKVINRDCRFFPTQPFGRCRVTFHYLKSDEFIDIYEEFTFNNQGEITFIEAWSDVRGYLPMPDPNLDPWAEGEGVERLSTKVPGLGSHNGKLHKKALKYMAKWDEDLKNLRKRLRFPLIKWTKEAIRLLIKGHHVEPRDGTAF